MIGGFRQFLPGLPLSFDYTNHKGVTERRNVVYGCLEFGSNEYYPEPQFLIRCFDPSRGAERSFAIANIRNWA